MIPDRDNVLLDQTKKTSYHSTIWTRGDLCSIPKNLHHSIVKRGRWYQSTTQGMGSRNKSCMLLDREDVLQCQQNKLPLWKLNSVTHVRSRRIRTIQLLGEVDGINPLPKVCEAEIVGNVKLELWKPVNETDFIFSVPKPIIEVPELQQKGSQQRHTNFRDRNLK
ncbi:hypothetical protein QYM36_002340, partial [Artemia franciscana]